MPVDVRINTVASRVRVADADALLSPEILDRIVAVVRERLAEDQAAARELDDDKTVLDRAARLG